MKLKFHYPLWVHIPALLLTALSFPGIPYFLFWEEKKITGGRGITDAGLVAILLITILGGLSFLALMLSVAADEGYARRETRKTFNWRSLLDELIIGAIVFVQAGLLAMAQGANSLSSAYLLPLVIGVAIAVALEALRPFRPYKSPIIPEDVSALEAELTERWKAGQSAVCWEVNTPQLSVIVIGLVLPAAAAALMGFLRAWPPFGFWVAMFFWIAFSLQRLKVAVTKEQIVVKREFLDFRPLTLRPTDIREVALNLVSTDEDFRGYIVYGPNILRNRFWIKFFSRPDNRYVRLITTDGKKYLIPVDHPDRLAAAIRAAKQAAEK